MTPKPVTRRSFLGTASMVATCSRPMPDQKPGIVLVITGDQGYSDLGCHGNSVINTPNMGLVHANAVRFETESKGGLTEPWTWFDRADATTRGAYYADVKRLRL